MTNALFSVAPQTHAGRRPGWLGRRMILRMMQPVMVSLVEPLAGAFVMVELSCSPLAGVSWGPGQRFGLVLNERLESRTYTPMTWDARTGSMRMLMFRHGAGLASDWAGLVKPGDTCDLVGPVPSIDPPPAGTAATLFGDETSIGTAVALAQAGCAAGCVRYLFEATSAAASRDILSTFGLSDAIVIERRPDNAHFADMSEHIARDHGHGDPVMLTGKAGSIQWLRRSLGLAGLPTRDLRGKAYWAPGKSGLT